MYCSVAFSFQSETKPVKKCRVYKTNGIPVKHGDIVEVVKHGKPMLGVVNRVFEADAYKYRFINRLSVERKLHTNTVKALVRKRFNEFKDIKMGKKSKRLKRKVTHWLGDDYLREILKWICLGNMYGTSDKLLKVRYKHCFVLIAVADDGSYVIQGVSVNKPEDYEGYKWKVSQKARDYFEELINQ